LIFVDLHADCPGVVRMQMDTSAENDVTRRTFAPVVLKCGKTGLAEIVHVLNEAVTGNDRG
jgi:hypothetical protein